MIDFMDSEFIFNMALVILAAFVGGLTTAILGFLGTSEKFDTKKFLASALKSFIGAIVIAYGVYQAAMFNLGILFLAFLSGAGVEAGVKRVSNLITKPSDTITIVQGDSPSPK
jgi:hypothetical protein